MIKVSISHLNEVFRLKEWNPNEFLHFAVFCIFIVLVRVQLYFHCYPSILNIKKNCLTLGKCVWKMCSWGMYCSLKNSSKA